MMFRSAAVALLFAATSASAQDWSGRLTLYGWLPTADVDTTLERRGAGVSGEASAGIDDILDALNFAAFATVEARRGRLGLIGDFVYTDLAFDKTGALGVQRGVDLTLFMGTGAVAWRTWEDGVGYLDVLGGGRVVSAEVGVSRSGALVSASATSTETYVDPLIGLRAGYAVNDKVALTALGNVGGFGVGSELTWELFGGVSYAFTDRILGDLGYRYLSIDYEGDNTTLDTQLHGPAIGVTVGF